MKTMADLQKIDTGYVGRRTRYATMAMADDKTWFVALPEGDPAAVGDTLRIKRQTGTCEVDVLERVDVAATAYTDGYTLVTASDPRRVLSSAERRRATALIGKAEVWDGDRPTYVDV